MMHFEIDASPVYAYTGARPFDRMQPSVVFVHGAGLDHSVWLLQSRWFAHHGYNALALDLPGHGRSGGDLLADIESMADWIERVLDALGIETAAVVGHSMGSLVTLAAAARAPARIDFAGLLGIAVPMRVNTALLAAAEAGEHAALDMINLWGHGFASQIGGNRAPGMWMTGAALRVLEQARPGVVYNDLRACGAYADGLAHAARVRCPALVLLGSDDVMAPPRGADALLAALPDAELEVLDGCGHMLMAERPDEVLDALRAAIADADRRRGP